MYITVVHNYTSVIMSSSRALRVLPSVKRQTEHDFYFFSIPCIIKQLLDSVFVISTIIMVSGGVIAKTSSNNCV